MKQGGWQADVLHPLKDNARLVSFESSYHLKALTERINLSEGKDWEKVLCITAVVTEDTSTKGVYYM